MDSPVRYVIIDFQHIWFVSEKEDIFVAHTLIMKNIKYVDCLAKRKLLGSSTGKKNKGQNNFQLIIVEWQKEKLCVYFIGVVFSLVF